MESLHDSWDDDVNFIFKVMWKSINLDKDYIISNN